MSPEIGTRRRPRRAVAAQVACRARVSNWYDVARSHELAKTVWVRMCETRDQLPPDADRYGRVGEYVRGGYSPFPKAAHPVAAGDGTTRTNAFLSAQARHRDATAARAAAASVFAPGAWKKTKGNRWREKQRSWGSPSVSFETALQSKDARKV